VNAADADRFWARVSRIEGADDCALFLRRDADLSNGYGSFWLNGAKVGAHRVAWELCHGPIPPGMHVLHHCDVRPCVAHLFLGDDAANMADRHAKGRDAKGDAHGSRTHPERLARGLRHGSRTHPESVPRGDRHGSRTHPESVPRGDVNGARKHPERLARGNRNGLAKLCEADIEEIRRRLASGETHVSVAYSFDVSKAAIGKISTGKTWRHVAEKEVVNAGS